MGIARLACLCLYRGINFHLDFGKPVTVWYKALFEYYNIYCLVPVQFIVNRAVGLIDKLDGKSVLFSVPCLDH
jgi:hypothetical protein